MILNISRQEQEEEHDEEEVENNEGKYQQIN
jgi:hypothetical protein